MTPASKRSALTIRPLPRRTHGIEFAMAPAMTMWLMSPTLHG